VRQLVEAGFVYRDRERVNLPDFRSGLLQLTFAPNSAEMRAATPIFGAGCAAKVAERLHQGSIGSGVANESILTVTVTYAPLNTGVAQSRPRVRRQRMIFSCCDEKRKAAVIGNPTINGIDYLEVIDHAASSASLRQRTLLVTASRPHDRSDGEQRADRRR